MKLKRIASAVMAAVMAVTSAVVCEVTASAETFDPAPDGEETVLATMEGITAPCTLASYGTQWIQSYASGLSNWLAESNTYLKVSVTDVTDYNETKFDVILGWDLSSWFQFMCVDGNWYMPVGDVSAASSVVYVPLSSFTLNEYNGIGFNIQAGHVGFTVSSAEIVKVDIDDGSNDEVIWTGSTNLGTDWSPSVSVNAFTLNKNDKLKIYYTVGSADYHQLKITDGGWTPLTSVPGTNEWDSATVASDGTFKFTVGSDDAASVTEKGLIVSGYDTTITKIAVVRATVPVSSVTITNKPANTTVYVNDTITLEAKVNDDATVSDKTVAWISLNTEVADYADSDGAGKLNGEFKFFKAGTVTIEAVYGPDNDIKDTVTFTVVEPSITIGTTADNGNTASLGLKVGDEKALEVKFTPENTTDKTVTWTSSATDVATVDFTGLVKAIKAGTANITATTANGKTATCKITVSETDIPVKTVTITKPTTTECTVGQTVSLTAAVNADANVADKTISWKSSDEAVATVKDGKVTFLKAGSVKITAYYSSATADAAIEDSVTFTVKEYLESSVKYNEVAKDKVVKVDAKINNSFADVFVFAISKEDAAKCNYLEITITLPDGTTKTLKLDTVYNQFTFKNADGAKVIETGADGTYFGLFKVSGGSQQLRNDLKFDIKPCI